MIALKDSPIWAALGDGAGDYTDTLDNPFPPFAFNSGMDWRDVPRAECEELGLIAGDETPGKMEGELDPGDREVQAALRSLGPEFRRDLLKDMEDPASEKQLPHTAVHVTDKQNEHKIDRGDEGTAPESAAADIRGILGADGGRPPFGFGSQQRAVEQWAGERGIRLPWEQATTGAVEGGVEHLVRADPATGRIVKITIPPVFGRSAWVGRDGTPGLFEATPLACLERWRLSNEAFGDDVRVVGATAQTEGFPSLIVSQPWVPGNPPSQELLVDYLASRGFQKIPGTHVFYNEAGRLAIFDARPANFVERDGVPVAVDVIPVAVDGRMHEALVRLRGEGRP